MTKIWVLLAIGNLFSIILLTIFAAVVYDRIAIDLFSPPVYSIWARPGDTWHHAELAISPSYASKWPLTGEAYLITDTRVISTQAASGMAKAILKIAPDWP